MNRLIMWTAFALFLLGSLYVIVTTYGISVTGFSEPITGLTLTIMEVLTMLSAPLIVILLVLTGSAMPPERKAFGTIALCFSVIAAGLTSAVHFVSLTAVAQTGTQLLSWPSSWYALELLAWDLFLGLALCFYSLAYSGGGLDKYIRVGLLLVGFLCLSGLSGPVTGDMRLQFIAVAGYGIILPVIWLLIALDYKQVFRKEWASAS